MLHQQRKRLQLQACLIDSATGAGHIVLLVAVRADQHVCLEPGGIQVLAATRALAGVRIKAAVQATKQNRLTANVDCLHGALNQGADAGYLLPRSIFSSWCCTAISLQWNQLWKRLGLFDD